MPAPRKLPSQSRSRSLVSALIEACLRILQGEGAEALTMHRLSEVSGVAVGSIYQYFPNMEAIVTLAFDHILDEEATVHVAALRERIAGLALDAALREILDNMVRMELRLYRLHREFHLKYHPDLKVGMRTGPYENTRQYVDEAWSVFVTMYLPSLDPLRRDMAAYMLGIGMRATIFSSTSGDTLCGKTSLKPWISRPMPCAFTWSPSPTVSMSSVVSSK